LEWTADRVRQMLETNQTWLERGVLAIYARQTWDEQEAHSTHLNNGVGFNAADASYLSYIATWLLSGKKLSGSHLENTRRRMLKYAGQLARIANAKEDCIS